VLRLTNLLGRPATADAADVGALRDLSFRLGASGSQPTVAGPAVEGLVVGRRSATRLVPWSAIDPTSIGDHSDRRTPVRLITALPPTRELFDDELLLGRDVLDTQIIDVVGHRVNRVGDIILEPRDGRLVTVGVEVGPASLVRRLGFRRAADHLAEHVVAWTDLHLTSARGHTVQLATSAAALHRLDAGELAELIARLPSSHAVDVLAAVPPERATEALHLSHPHLQGRLRRLQVSTEPARPRWQRLRGWDRRHGPVQR